ncbi:MAG: 2Fe-2S iron-sulfur cluster-binding protein [Gemmatimonadota bacterium]
MTRIVPRARTAQVQFLPSQREIEVPHGAHLTAAAVSAGVAIVHDCDGQGVCSTCRVQVVEGGQNLSPLDARERDQLGADVDRQWRLCCLVRVLGDVVVRVPEGGFAYPPELQRERG